MAPKIPDNDSSPSPLEVTGRSPMPAPDQQSAPPPHQHAAPSAIGTALGQARKAKGKSIEQVAGRLRIRVAFLKALEAGDNNALPGHVYAIGFLRSYAEYLGLDPVQAVHDYKQEATDLAHLTELSFPIPMTPRAATGMPLMVVAAALSLVALAGWFATQSNTVRVAEGIQPPPGLSRADLTIIANDEPATTQPRSAAPHIATALLHIARPSSPASPDSTAPQLARRQPLPTATAHVSQAVPWPAYVLPLDVVAALKQPAAVAKAPPPTPVRRPAVSKKPAAKAAPGTSRDIARPATPAASATAMVPAENAAADVAATIGRSTTTRAAPSGNDIPAAAEAAAVETASLVYIPAIPPEIGALDQGHAYGQANRDARIVIAAEADIWIQIRDLDQNDLFTRLLRAGDSYRVPNRPDLLLFTGNAGGLRLTVDGRPVAPLGEDGAVRRDVALNADRLLSGTTTQ